MIDDGKAHLRFYLDMLPSRCLYSHFEKAQLIDWIRGKQLAVPGIARTYLDEMGIC